MCTTININTFLGEKGFIGESLQRARTLITDLGIISGRKENMSSDKVPKIEEVIKEFILPYCGNKLCEELGDPEGTSEHVLVKPANCKVCNGSNNKRAIHLLAQNMKYRGMSKLLVVGGGPGIHDELRHLCQLVGIECKIVDGERDSHNQRKAILDMRWADLMAIWSSTIISHDTANHYTDNKPSKLLHAVVPRRSIEALCQILSEKIAI